MRRIEGSDKKAITGLSHFVGFGLVLGFLLPHTSTALLLINPLMCLFYQLFKKNQFIYKKNIIVLIPLLISLVINLLLGVSGKPILQCVTILLYFLCFPMVGDIRVPNSYLVFILVVIVFSQFIYILHIPFFINLLNTYYPISENDAQGIMYMQNSVTFGNMLSYRLSGIYRNPNQCSRYLSFLLAAFLIFNNNKPIRKWFPFLIVSFIAILLTGSRTGFVVASVIIVVFLFENKSIPIKWRKWIFLPIVFGLVFLLLSGNSSFRGAKIIDGGSLDSKFWVFKDYLSHEDSVIRLLFGHLDPKQFESSFGVMDQFDADYGYIIYQYGFIGFFCFLLFFFSIFRRVNNYGRIFFILLLWMFTSTIITSYRALFVFMILLSLSYNQFIDKRFL